MISRYFARYFILLVCLPLCLPLGAEADSDGFLYISAFPHKQTGFMPARSALVKKHYPGLYDRIGDTYEDLSCALSAWEYQDSDKKDCPYDQQLRPLQGNIFRLPPLMPNIGGYRYTSTKTTPFQLFSDYEGDLTKFTYSLRDGPRVDASYNCSYQTLGEIRLYFGDDIPDGWLPADGRELKVTEHQALYSIIDRRFGGKTMQIFRLPLLSGSLIYLDGSMKTVTPVIRATMDAPMLEYTLGDIILSVNPKIGLTPCEGMDMVSIEGRYPRIVPIEKNQYALHSVIAHRYGGKGMTFAYPHVYRKPDAEGNAIQFYMVTEGMYPHRY